MPISPEEINADNLPVGVRGFQKEATENLLKLIAWDYRRVLREQSLDEEELQRLRNRADQLETELQALRSLLDAQPTVDVERHSELQAEVERLQSVLAMHRKREQLPQALLESALRTARETRERARTECEELLRAARRRAVEIEQEAHASVRRSSVEVDRLRRMEHDLREQLRTMLQAVIEDGSSTSNGNGSANGNGAAVEPVLPEIVTPATR